MKRPADRLFGAMHDIQQLTDLGYSEGFRSDDRELRERSVWIFTELLHCQLADTLPTFCSGIGEMTAESIWGEVTDLSQLDP